jgi:hypothetical protein
MTISRQKNHPERGIFATPNGDKIGHSAYCDPLFLGITLDRACLLSDGEQQEGFEIGPSATGAMTDKERRPGRGTGTPLHKGFT